MKKEEKERPFLPIDGSESAHTLLIPLQKTNGLGLELRIQL